MRFKLLAPHYINQEVLPEGTIVGDGDGDKALDANFERPSGLMEPLDAEAKSAWKDRDSYYKSHGAASTPAPTEASTVGPIVARAASPAAPRPDAPNTPNPNSIGDIAPAQAGGLAPEENRTNYSSPNKEEGRTEREAEEARKAGEQLNPPKVPTSNPASEPNLKVGAQPSLITPKKV